ncbi:MAG: hypothetical protein WCR97_01575 [Bacilli bacterium]
MKDKLVRYHHKTMYYIVKKAGIGLSCIVGSCVLLALPLSIGLNAVKENEKSQSISEQKNDTNVDIKVLSF